MSTRFVELAEMVAAELNAGTFSTPFAATSDWVPAITVAPEDGEDHATNVEGVLVTVVSASRESSRVARGVIAYDYVFLLGIYKRIGVLTSGRVDPTQVEEMAMLVEEIEELFAGVRPLTGAANTAVVWQSSTPQLYDFDALRSAKEFRSYVRVVIREAKS